MEKKELDFVVNVLEEAMASYQELAIEHGISGKALTRFIFGAANITVDAIDTIRSNLCKEEN